MNALPQKEPLVKVVLAYVFALVFCAAFLRAIWLPSESYFASLVLISVGGSMIFPFLRDLLGLPPRGNFEKFMRIMRQFQQGLKYAKEWRNVGAREKDSQGGVPAKGIRHPAVRATLAPRVEA